MSDSAKAEKKAAHRAKMKEAKRKAREKRDGQKVEPQQNPEPPQNSEPQLEIYAVNYNFIRAPWLRF